MGLLARVREKLKAEIKQGRDLVNATKRSASNFVDDFRVGSQPIRRFIQDNPTPASFVNKKIIQPSIKSNLNTLDNIKVGAQNYFKPTTVNNKLNLRTRDVVRELGTQTKI